ncbi:MAG TPA: outer membrane beta-barrel protein [Chitinophagaceae bacterium]|nr:outer membrane beta-barrel protein [Chitinophagaceae bacterium]
MPNLHDDNHLDNLSRKAAEEFQPDQELHSWQKLHPHLEAALPQKKESKRRFLIILFLFLLIGGGITLSAILINGPAPVADTENTDAGKTSGTTAPSTKTTEKSSATTGTETAPPNVTPTEKASGKPGANDSQPQQTQESTIDQPERSVSSGNANSSEFSINRKKPATQQDIARQINRDQKRATADKSNEPVKTDRQTDNPDVAKHLPNKTVDKTTDASVSDKTSDKTAVKPADVSDKTIVDPSGATDKAANKTADQSAGNNHPRLAADPTPNREFPKNNKQIPPLKNRWEFGLTYAPDISTVKFSHTQEPGHNFGATVAYNISRRLAVQTGAIYTTKNYKSNGSDYHPPKGYWTDYVKLETVTASCSMWDIPLNLRYNMTPRKKSNFYASAGLSSYLMQQEDYDFFYYYNGAPVSRYRSMDNSSKHWMSVLNLSVAYERQLGKNFSLQAEPFFKQPLNGVGFGSVRLNSTGVYFTLKYKPLSGRLSR